MKGLASAFISFFKTEKYDKRKEIYENGESHSYPFLVEQYIAESVTARRCAETMASYLTGKGFGDDLNKIVVNDKKETTLLNFLQDVSNSIAEQNGVFIHVNWNANYEIDSLNVIPFPHCAVGKKDDNDYNGKILVCSDWKNSGAIKKAVKFDVYNDDRKVIDEQVRKAGGWRKYKGQILYFKFGKYIYPHAHIHPVMQDADSERQAAIYKNQSLKKGFFGKTVVVTKPLVDPTLDDVSDPEYIKQDKARKQFRENLKDFVGASNADGIMHIEMEFNSDEIDKELMFKNIDTNLDDKLFEYTEKSSSENICIAYSINPNLIRPTNTALFSQSGESYKQMKIDYQEETSDERLVIEQLINKLMNKFKTSYSNLTIIPRIEIEIPIANELTD